MTCTERMTPQVAGKLGWTERCPDCGCPVPREGACWDCQQVLQGRVFVIPPRERGGRDAH